MVLVDLGNGEALAGEPHWTAAVTEGPSAIKAWRQRRDPRDFGAMHCQVRERMTARQSAGELRLVAGPKVREYTSLAEAVDGGTPDHSRRVGAAAEAVARRMGLDERFVTLIRDAAPLHDLGKLEVPRAILDKQGPLTMRERVVMQRHTSAGEAMCLAEAADPVLRLAARIARSHHERWDGRGYPDGLAFDAIPLGARIVAVVDVFDALVSERPYKGAWSVERAIRLLVDGAGSQFDPDVVEAFVALVQRGDLAS